MPLYAYIRATENRHHKRLHSQRFKSSNSLLKMSMDTKLFKIFSYNLIFKLKFFVFLTVKFCGIIFGTKEYRHELSLYPMYKRFV